MPFSTSLSIEKCCQSEESRCVLLFLLLYRAVFEVCVPPCPIHLCLPVVLCVLPIRPKLRWCRMHCSLNIPRKISSEFSTSEIEGKSGSQGILKGERNVHSLRVTKGVFFLVAAPRAPLFTLHLTLTRFIPPCLAA